jgi:SecD/SecF fusion protein
MSILQFQLSIMLLALLIGMVAIVCRRVVLFRALVVAGIAAAALLQMLAGPGFPLRLGLDLRGGTEIGLRLHPDPGRLRQLRGEKEELLALLENDGKDISLRMALSQKEIEIAAELANQQHHLAGAVDVVRHRLSGVGLSQVNVIRQGLDRVIAQFPGMDPAETRRSVMALAEQGHLEFRLVVPRRGTVGQRDLYRRIDAMDMSHDSMNIRDGDMLYDWLAIPQLSGADDADRLSLFYLVEKEPLIVGDNIKFAHAESDRSGDVWWVNVEFDQAGRKQFHAVTAANRGSQLGIVLDGKLISAPRIREEIGEGVVDIVGNFDRARARQLEIVLKSGALKVRVTSESEVAVGPSLGEDSIRHGVFSMLVGLVAVLLFMVVYYRCGGVITDIALALNMLILLAVLSLTQSTLTLPGIAGLILIVGMMVDANVLTFERIREERMTGAELGSAIASGYDRSFATIVDANLTTLIAAAFLYFMGSEMLRGFALVLMLGIIVSVFCSLVISRWLLDGLFELGVVRRFSTLGYSRLPGINFVAWFKHAAVASMILILVGVVLFSLREKSGRNYGIDFGGGMLLQVAMAEPLTTADMRQRVNQAADPSLVDGPITLQSYGRAEGGGGRQEMFRHFLIRLPHVAHDDGIGADTRLVALMESLRGNLRGLAPDEPFPRAAMVGPAVAQEMSRRGLIAVSAALLSLFVYMCVRYRFSPAFGFGAVVALSHDLLVAVAALLIVDQLGWIDGRIDLKIVSALLTTIGYSLNDTIVVFNRIRENCRGSAPTAAVVNLSINQSLSRTVTTSVTTLLVVASLLLLGGDVMRGFAFVLIVGVVAGTYSSIFIASPILLLFTRENRKISPSRTSST